MHIIPPYPWCTREVGGSWGVRYRLKLIQIPLLLEVRSWDEVGVWIKQGSAALGINGYFASLFYEFPVVIALVLSQPSLFFVTV